MALSIRAFEGLRAQNACSSSTFCSGPTSIRPARLGFFVIAQKKVKKFQKVVLAKPVQGLGKTGQLTKALNGYYRNFLLPQGLALPATQGVLENIKREEDAAIAKALAIKQKAEAMATALKTIGKFIIKKKVSESNRLFASVTVQDVVDAIAQQTGRTLDKKAISLPDIDEVGTFDASIKLHPEVTGSFKVVVQREKNK